VPIFINALTNAVSLEKEGRLRILAVASLQRSQLAPQLPTVAEQGVPNFNATPFQAMYGPPGMAADLLKTLSAALRQGVSSSEQQIKGLSFDPAASFPEQLADFVKAEIAQWTRVARNAKIEPE